MNIKVNRSLVPIKAHFFFFFAALGPILPQLNVFGRQLGVSAAAMGAVTSVLPLLWAAAKPLFGYLVDFWPNHRKLVFMLLITVMTSSYCGLWFTPQSENPHSETSAVHQFVYKLNDTVYLEKYDNSTGTLDSYTCHWSCDAAEKQFDIYMTNFTFVSTIYVDSDNLSCSLLQMNDDEVREEDVVCLPKENCDLMCYEDESLLEMSDRDSWLDRTKRDVTNASNHAETSPPKERLGAKDDVKLSNVSKMFSRSTVEGENQDGSLYMTATFWVFVVLMCVGTVAFNVANCIGDAVCFDVLGPNPSKYGSQRAFGTAGYGVTALLGGYLVDRASGQTKNFAPAFLIALACTAVDLFSCRALTLPSLSSPADSGKALRDVLRMPRVLLFIVFAVVAGTLDSFIIYYMFWFVEELAEQTGSMGQIKLIEGVVVAGESFIGEILFFALSGKIISRFGFGATMTFSLFCYGVRLALISCIQHPWHLVIIESAMQGPTYALCYSTIVGYAAHVAPEGYSATVQGVVGGMDDGVGFALGSLLGGQLYTWAGGRAAFRVLAGAACACAALHAALFALLTRQKAEKQPTEVPEEEGEKMLPLDSGAIYRETVVPVDNKANNKTRR